MKQKTEIEYIKKDDYYIPNLTLKKKNRKVNLGKFALLRLNYLKEHKKALYQSLLMRDMLIEELLEVDLKSQAMLEKIINKLKEKNNLTEDIKSTNQLYWVGTMNAIREQAEEVIFNKIIYN